MVKERADKSNIKCYQFFLLHTHTHTQRNKRKLSLLSLGRAISPIPHIDTPFCTNTHTHWQYSHLNILIQSTANILNGTNNSFFRIQNPSSTLTTEHKWHKLLLNSIKNSYSIYIAAAMLGLCQQLVWFFNSINV